MAALEGGGVDLIALHPAEIPLITKLYSSQAPHSDVQVEVSKPMFVPRIPSSI